MPNLVSLFSGGGGMDCGLEAAGFESRFCTDIDFHSCETLKQMKALALANRGGGLRNAHVEQKNIELLEPEEILSLARLRAGEVDLLAGGPPCQSFSVFGRRQGLDDPRGTLVWQYLRILRGVRPRVFLFENVPGLLSIEDGLVFQRFMEQAQQPFGRYRYAVKKYVLEAARYGVPQFRTRVIVLGVLEDTGVEAPPVSPPLQTHSEPNTLLFTGATLPFNTVRDALQGLPLIGAHGAPCNHVGRSHGNNIIERYEALAHGERDPVTRINKLHPERPSYTIIVGSDKGGGKGHVHPDLPREVTPRESARMQSFPDGWGFSGTSRHPIRQVGNAVPPILAAAIGSFLTQEIFGERPRAREEMWRLLSQQHLLNAEAEKMRALQSATPRPVAAPLPNRPSRVGALRAIASLPR